MDFRKADIEDIQHLLRLRKQQLLDEGLLPVNNIDKELTDYFSLSLAENSLISLIALDSSSIIATSGICFYQLPASYSNLTGRVAYITNMFTEKNIERKGLPSICLNL